MTINKSNTAFGLTITGYADDVIPHVTKKYGYHGLDEVAFIQALLKPMENPVCLDIGTNIGTHAVAMAKYAKVVHTFEPQSDIIPILKKNLAQNQCQNCRINNFGLSDEDAKLTLSIRSGNNGGSTLHPDKMDKNTPQTRCEFKKGDGYVEAANLDRLDLIKMDIEKHEPQALSGLKHAIEKHQPIIILEWNGNDSKTGFEQYRLFETALKNYDIIALENSIGAFKQHIKGKLFSGLRRYLHFKLTKYIPVKTTLFNPSKNYSAAILVPKQKQPLVDNALKGLQYLNINFLKFLKS